MSIEQQPATRSELVRAIQTAHATHGSFQGGNFFECRGCRLHVMFRSEALTWVPPRARKERPILTLDDVGETVRTRTSRL